MTTGSLNEPPGLGPQLAPGELRRRSVRGAGAVLLSSGFSFIVTIGSTAALARLLTPEDFGLIAMVTAVTGFIGLLNDLGLSMAVVQSRDLDHRQLSTVFWLNLMLGGLLGLGCAAIAPLVAWLYGEPRLLAVTIVLGLGFPLAALSGMHAALLRRQMRLTVAAWLGPVGQLVGVTAAIAAAAGGLGYWALVLLPLTGAAASGLLAWVVSGWAPGRPVRGAGVRPMIRFGVFLTGFNFVNYFARNADNVLIGWWWGASPLGLYSRAYALLTLPIRQINGPISAAAIPALSRLQDDPARYARFYVRGVSLSTLLAMPGVAFMFVAADDLVALILGAQWAGTVPIFRVLAVAALMQVVSNSQGWLYVSGGRTKAMFAWGLVSAPLFVLGFALGLPWGPVGVAWSMVITQGVLFVPGLWLATRAMSAGPLQVLAGVGPNLVSALAGGAVSWVVMPMLRTGIPVVDAATAFAIVAVVYAIGVFGVFRRWAFVRSVLGELRGRREQEAIPDQAMG